MNTIEIEKRYGDLAEQDCCLSCGGAINYSEAQPGEVCVDLGSGRGTDAIRLSEEVGENGFVYGIDISNGMLKKAEKTAKKLQVANVRFIKSELEKLPVEDSKVDLLISNCTINHAKDKQAVWNEVHRILKKGGRFVVSDIYASEPVPEQFKNDPVAVSECWAGASTKEEYIETLKAAGFNSIKIIEESKPYPKGEIQVSSFTIQGHKKKCNCA